MELHFLDKIIGKKCIFIKDFFHGYYPLLLSAPVFTKRDCPRSKTWTILTTFQRGFLQSGQQLLV
jgi:hypothetical protein